MKQCKKDFIIGNILWVTGLILSSQSIIVLSILYIFGLLLATGNIRHFYNKYLWAHFYWRRQRKLWGGTE